VGKVRARGAIPAVIYGAKDAATNLEVDRKDIEKLLSRAVGENILVELEIRDGGKTSTRISLIQEVQHHPVRGEIIHIDFHAVSMTEEIDAEVVLEPEGEPIGVKTFGGLLQQNMRSLPIRCCRKISRDHRRGCLGAQHGESLHVRDLKLPAGVVAVPDGDLTVFLVSEPAVAEEPAVAARNRCSGKLSKRRNRRHPKPAAEPRSSPRLARGTCIRLPCYRRSGKRVREYFGTRHNAGFLIVDELARRFAMPFRFEPKWDAEIAPCGGRLLMKPQTFMNLSGEAVENYARYHRIDPSEVLVVLDDAAIPLGELRLRPSGSAGGHNGLESVLMHFATESVPRLRFGLGRLPAPLWIMLGNLSPPELSRCRASARVEPRGGCRRVYRRSQARSRHEHLQ
jgi:aminoacyl-tRNA hydrolase/ribosomal protein bL25 (Ctc-form)